LGRSRRFNRERWAKLGLARDWAAREKKRGVARPVLLRDGNGYKPIGYCPPHPYPPDKILPTPIPTPACGYKNSPIPIPARVFVPNG
jgi:hypothetical protein